MGTDINALPIDTDENAEILTVVNRTSETLSATHDGRQYQIAPHSRKFFNWRVANALKAQNPQPGTENPYSLSPKDAEFLIGVVEWGDDCSPVERSRAIERFDTSLLPNADKRHTQRSGTPSRHRSQVVSDVKRPQGAVFIADHGTSDG